MFKATTTAAIFNYFKVFSLFCHCFCWMRLLRLTTVTKKCNSTPYSYSIHLTQQDIQFAVLSPITAFMLIFSILAAQCLLSLFGMYVISTPVYPSATKTPEWHYLTIHWLVWFAAIHASSPLTHECIVLCHCQQNAALVRLNPSERFRETSWHYSLWPTS